MALHPEPRKDEPLRTGPPALPLRLPHLRRNALEHVDQIVDPVPASAPFQIPPATRYQHALQTLLENIRPDQAGLLVLGQLLVRFGGVPLERVVVHPHRHRNRSAPLVRTLFGRLLVAPDQNGHPRLRRVVHLLLHQPPRVLSGRRDPQTRLVPPAIRLGNAFGFVVRLRIGQLRLVDRHLRLVRRVHPVPRTGHDLQVAPGDQTAVAHRVVGHHRPEILPAGHVLRAVRQEIQPQKILHVREPLLRLGVDRAHVDLAASLEVHLQHIDDRGLERLAARSVRNHQ